MGKALERSFMSISNNFFVFKEYFDSFYYNKNIPGSTKALLLSSSGNSHGLLYPLHYYRRELADEFLFFFKEIISDDLNEKRKSLESFDGDVVFISMPLRIDGQITSKKTVLEFFQSLTSLKKFKLIYFDVSDSAISPYFGILPYVDLFLMPFIFKEKNNYSKHFLGGNMFADFMLKQYELKPTAENEYFDELFYSRPADSQIEKIVISWNWIFWKRMVKTFQNQNFCCLENTNRNMDISCRFHPYSGWCQVHRMDVYKKLKSLSSSFAVETSIDKVNILQYYKELANSKISFSPFGYGEICPKDFEAVMKGALLVKPSVEHLKTFPELHFPYKTYVPVEWDLSNMISTLQNILKSSENRHQMAIEASKIYTEVFLKKSFLEKFQEILKLVSNSCRR